MRLALIVVPNLVVAAFTLWLPFWQQSVVMVVFGTLYGLLLGSKLWGGAS